MRKCGLQPHDLLVATAEAFRSWTEPMYNQVELMLQGLCCVCASSDRVEVMTMTVSAATQLEEAFLSLPRAERETIITYGTSLRLSSLRKRQFLAQSKIDDLESKYHRTLAQLDMEGLPDDAGYEMHEDYVMWHHWQEVLKAVGQDIIALERIAGEGFPPQGIDDVGE